MERVLKNLNVLHSFECAARLQSYSLAAKELCISQAAVSQQMRQLESTLGCQLFLRKGKKMLLTQKGQTLFSAAQRAFRQLQKGINEIKSQELSGSLTITSTQAFISLWLMPRLSQFSSQYPDIRVHVVSSPGFDDLRQRHIDLAIRFGARVEQNTGIDYRCEYFGEDSVYPVCSPQLAKELDLKEPLDLLKTWLVTLEKPGAFNWGTWFEQTGITAYKQHQQWTQVHTTDMALNAVQNAHGVTLAARYLCQQQLDSGQLVHPIKLPHPTKVKRYLVFDPSSAKLKRIEAFSDWLKQAMTEHKNE